MVFKSPDSKVVILLSYDDLIFMSKKMVLIKLFLSAVITYLTFLCYRYLERDRTLSYRLRLYMKIKQKFYTENALK